MERWDPTMHCPVGGEWGRPALFTRIPDCKPDGLTFKNDLWWLRHRPIRPCEAASLVLVATVESGNAVIERMRQWERRDDLAILEWENAVLSMNLRDIIAQRQRLANLETQT